jgi:hypothetical protein
LKTEPRIFPVEAAINSNIELYLSITSRVAKYNSDPKGIMVATKKLTVNKERYIINIIKKNKSN